MSGADGIKERLLRAVLDAHQDEYHDAWDTWKHLDVKAQGSIAIAGVFLAGIFAYAGRVPADACLYHKLIIVGAVACVAFSVMFAMLALRLREVAPPPLGSEVGEMVAHILSRDEGDALREREVNFSSDRIRLWGDVNEEMRSVNGKKAGHLKATQWLLFAVVVLATWLTIGQVLGVQP
jgi:hypothetical protein